MHHGQSRGKRNAQKVCKNDVNFMKVGVDFLRVRDQRNWGKFWNLWSMTKKRSSETFADENRNFFWKRSNMENFRRSLRNFSEIGGNSETRGKCIMASWGKREIVNIRPQYNGLTIFVLFYSTSFYLYFCNWEIKKLNVSVKFFLSLIFLD